MGLRIGIDPGLQGSIAFITDDFKCLAVLDMPVMALTVKRQQVNAAEIAKLFEFWRRKREGNLTAYLEAASAMPKQGVSSMFSFGMSYGIIQGVLAALQIPFVLVKPRAWKARAGLLKKPKDAARSLAQQLYPDVSLALKRDIGRADALLIAHFGKE